MELLVDAGKTPGCCPLKGLAGFIFPGKAADAERARQLSSQTARSGTEPCLILTARCKTKVHIITATSRWETAQNLQSHWKENSGSGTQSAKPAFLRAGGGLEAGRAGARRGRRVQNRRPCCGRLNASSPAREKLKWLYGAGERRGNPEPRRGSERGRAVRAGPPPPRPESYNVSPRARHCCSFPASCSQSSPRPVMAAPAGTRIRPQIASPAPPAEPAGRPAAPPPACRPEPETGFAGGAAAPAGTPDPAQRTERPGAAAPAPGQGGAADAALPDNRPRPRAAPGAARAAGPLRGRLGAARPGRAREEAAASAQPGPCAALTVRLRDSQARRPPPPRGPLGARLEAQARIAAAGADPPRRAGGRKRRGPTSGPSARLGSTPRPRRARVPLVCRRGASGRPAPAPSPSPSPLPRPRVVSGRNTDSRRISRPGRAGVSVGRTRGPDMALLLRNLQRAVPVRRAPLRRRLQLLRAALGVQRFDLAVVCVDNRTIRRLNGVYRARDAPTDVLSFPFHEVRRLPGPASAAGALGLSFRKPRTPVSGPGGTPLSATPLARGEPRPDAAGGQERSREPLRCF